MGADTGLPRVAAALGEARLRALYGEGTPLPCDTYAGLVDRDRLVDYAVETARRAVAVGGGTVFEASPGGVAAFQPLAWDTNVLGTPAGRVSLLEIDAALRADRAAAGRAAEALGRAAVDAARAAGVRHLSARFDARNLLLTQALERTGFELVDGILKFTFDLEREAIPAVDAPGVAIRDAVEGDIPALRDLAGRGFVYDRFHNDPVIPKPVADRLHAEWVENAIRGRTGCAVLLAQVDGVVGGFFILAEDALARETFGFGIGTLVLITVGSEFRRRGVAKALSWASLARLRERGNRFGEVGTQVANVPASTVYLSAGFRLAQTSLSLRWWDREAGR